MQASVQPDTAGQQKQNVQRLLPDDLHARTDEDLPIQVPHARVAVKNLQELLAIWVELRRRIREPSTPGDPDDREELQKKLWEIEDMIEAQQILSPFNYQGQDPGTGAIAGRFDLDLNKILGSALGGFLEKMHTKQQTPGTKTTTKITIKKTRRKRTT